VAEELKCVVRDSKEIFCEGPSFFSLYNSSQVSFKSSANYTILASSEPEVSKLVLRKINIGRDFVLNLTYFKKINSLLIENSAIKVSSSADFFWF